MTDAPAPVSENGVLSQDKGEENPGHKIFAGNLAYSVTSDALRQFFEPVESDIITAQVISRNRRSLGYGFVEVSSADAAQKAVDALNQKELEGRNVIVEVAKPADQKSKERSERRSKRRPGRRGAKAVPGEVTEAEANGVTDKTEATPAAEGAEKPRRRKNNIRKPRRNAKEGDANVTNGDTTAEGETFKEESTNKRRTRMPRKPRTPRPAGEEPTGEASKTVVFVANLAFSVDDASLATIFTDAGISVVNARVVRRRWGQPRRSKGYGFVEVGSESEQTKAIEALDGKEFDGGRKIVVKVAVNSSGEDKDDEAPAAN